MRTERKIALAAAIMGIMYASCQPINRNDPQAPKCDTVTIRDTIYKPIDTETVIFKEVVVMDDRRKMDSVYLANRRLADSFLLYKLKMNNVNKYVDIVVRNPTQLKFLKGWINRVNK